MDRSQAHPSVSEQNRDKFKAVNQYASFAEDALYEGAIEIAQVYATLAVAFQKWAQR